jgi:hypothetical protein
VRLSVEIKPPMWKEAGQVSLIQELEDLRHRRWNGRRATSETEEK